MTKVNTADTEATNLIKQWKEADQEENPAMQLELIMALRKSMYEHIDSNPTIYN